MSQARPVPITVRRQIFFEQNGLCECCGELMIVAKGASFAPGIFTVHHVKPRIRGGGNQRNNLVGLCWDCHRAIEGRYGESEGWFRCFLMSIGEKDMPIPGGGLQS